MSQLAADRRYPIRLTWHSDFVIRCVAVRYHFPVWHERLASRRFGQDAGTKAPATLWDGEIELDVSRCGGAARSVCDVMYGICLQRHFPLARDGATAQRGEFRDGVGHQIVRRRVVSDLSQQRQPGQLVDARASGAVEVTCKRRTVQDERAEEGC